MKANSGNLTSRSTKGRATINKGVVKLPLKSSLKTFGSKGMRQPRWQGAGGAGLKGGSSKKTND